MPTQYSEDALIERPAIALFAQLGYEAANCWGERFGRNGTLGRETSADVVLRPRLTAAVERLNPGMPREAVSEVVEELTRDRGAMSPAHANREVYRLLKNGVKVGVPSPDDKGRSVRTARVIDWVNPANNDFFLASQFKVSGEIYNRRADLVGFVNGLPLVFVELKASHRRLEDAYTGNLSDYKDTIPQLFWYNALIILSNGSQSRAGSVTASWEHFAEWKKINSEGEEGIVSLDTMIRGTCEPGRLLDIVETFTLFREAQGGLAKLVAKNHQYLGVNNAVDALRRVKQNDGRLGVFWHTQGSGKSYSMVFFSQKVLRKLPGNYTFLIVTDRQELDDQIYKTFADAGAVTEGQVQAQSGEHLRQLLREDHRNIFTLIQKFHTPRGEAYPILSERDDIIVITDEAHRSQYDVFALNMRNALPNAAFIGFTGTPLMAGEERTREVFGDYVSVYNFKQSVDDGATVPLYYENRIPELQLTNADLDADLERLIEEAELDEAQETRLEREFARQYHLITRDDRLEKIAADIVAHFMGRGQAGKAMVVSIDKLTAVRMYEKVRKHWRIYLSVTLILRRGLAPGYMALGRFVATRRPLPLSSARIGRPDGRVHRAPDRFVAARVPDSLLLEEGNTHVYIGVDTHKATHTLVGLDDRGRSEKALIIPNTPEGWNEALLWSRGIEGPHVWGVENSGSLGKGFAQFLLGQDEPSVHEVSPRRTAQYRRRARKQDKTDRADALAIARLLMAEGEDLPALRADDLSTELRILSDHRDNLLAERTRLINRLHAQMLQIDPSYREASGPLTKEEGILYCRTLTLESPARGGLPGTRLLIVRQLCDQVLRIDEEIAELNRVVHGKVRESDTPLIRMPGIGEVVAARLIGELGSAPRISSAAALASLAGIAPVEVSSGGHRGFRLNRGGNRKLNRAFHLIALVQLRCDARAKAYYAKKRAEGKTSREALRCLKRQLVNVVYRLLRPPDAVPSDGRRAAVAAA